MPEVRYLWNLHGEIASSERTYSPMTGQPMPLRSSDILAWCRLYGRRVTSWEAGIIQAIDRRYRTVMATRPGEEEPPAADDDDLDEDGD